MSIVLYPSELTPSQLAALKDGQIIRIEIDVSLQAICGQFVVLDVEGED